MSNKLGFAIVGLGTRAQRHAESISRLKGGYLAALYSRRLEKAFEFASRHGNPRIYDELEYLLEDERVDIVVVATPNSCHLKQAEMIARTGRSLIVECPIETSLDRAEALMGVAEDEGVFFSVPAEVLFSKEVCKAKALLEEGEIRTVYLDVWPQSELYNRASSWRVQESLAGKNIAMMDIFSMLLLITSLLGPAKNISRKGFSSCTLIFRQNIQVDISFKSPEGPRKSCLRVGDISIWDTQDNLTSSPPTTLDLFYESYLRSLEEGEEMFASSELLVQAMEILDSLCREFEDN